MKHSVSIERISELYRQGMASRQIGALTGVPYKTIVRYLKKAGVVLRNPGTPSNATYSDKSLLERLYIVEGKSTTQIAKEFGINASRVSHWLRRHGLETRSSGSEKGHLRMTEASSAKQSKARRGKYLGPDNWNWKGGVPFRDPDRHRYRAKMWIKAIKDRDGWQCVECKSTDSLHAHHIKRWRDYPELRYDLSNGVTLCYTCHERAHGHGFKFRWGFKNAKRRTSAPPPQ